MIRKSDNESPQLSEASTSIAGFVYVDVCGGVPAVSCVPGRPVLAGLQHSTRVGVGFC